MNKLGRPEISAIASGGIKRVGGVGYVPDYPKTKCWSNNLTLYRRHHYIGDGDTWWCTGSVKIENYFVRLPINHEIGESVVRVS